MARDHIHPPSAACLVASMRDLGYSLETAIADLVDNSISAGADAIDIICNVGDSLPVVMTLDNGRGMSESELVNAMRHGAVNPRQERPLHDLGRFGLGLKTASFSQCRSLTVVSRKNGILSGAEWDLDRIDDADDWVLSILDEPDIHALPYIDQLAGTGTAVIWRQLDRLVEDETGSRRDEIINEKLDVLDKHLALVFHRFLIGEVKGCKKISISVNGHRITGFDPFCRKNLATQILPEEIVRVGNAAVHMQPFILPHHSKLKADEYDFYQSRSDFMSNQGAYIYRNGRLMAWGDWFRLIPKGEATKLARVQIDFPNSLDESWTIDIKKSRARPPRMVRERLRQIISRVTERSAIVHRGRGQRLFQDISSPVWERYADHGGIRYSINTSHPLVQCIRGGLDETEARRFDLLLIALSSSLPVEMIYSDFSTQPRDLHQNPDGLDVKENLNELRLALWGDESGDADAFRDVVRSIRIFDGHGEAIEEYIKGAF